MIRFNRFSLFLIGILFGFCIGISHSFAQNTQNPNQQAYPYPNNVLNNAQGGYTLPSSNQAGTQLGNRFGFGNQSSSFGTTQSRRRSSSSRRSLRDQTSSINPQNSQQNTEGISKTNTRQFRPSAPSRSMSPSTSPGSTSDLTILNSGAGRPMGTIKKTSVPSPVLRKVTTLYLDATSQAVQINTPFTLDVKLSAPDSLTFDSLSFAIRFNPKDLIPIQGVDSSEKWIPANAVDYLPKERDENILSNFVFASDSDTTKVQTNTIDLRDGLVRFSVTHPNFSCSGTKVIARLVFVPLRPFVYSAIDFIFSDDAHSETDSKPITHLFKGNQDVLGLSSNATDGVVGIDFHTAESENPTSKNRISNKTSPHEESSQEMKEGDLPTCLQLINRQSSIHVGDTFEVDIHFSNPDNKTIDQMNLLILYNPKVLEVVDSNDSAPGVNIDDQKYQDQFPFDYPILNLADPEKGIIDYRKRAVRSLVRGDGIIGTIQFRSIRPTTKTSLRMLVNETGQEPTTGVFYRDQDLLGDRDDPYDGFKTTSVSVNATFAYLRSIEP